MICSSCTLFCSITLARYRNLIINIHWSIAIPLIDALNIKTSGNQGNWIFIDFDGFENSFWPPHIRIYQLIQIMIITGNVNIGRWIVVTSDICSSLQVFLNQFWSNAKIRPQKTSLNEQDLQNHAYSTSYNGWLISSRHYTFLNWAILSVYQAPKHHAIRTAKYTLTHIIYLCVVLHQTEVFIPPF